MKILFTILIIAAVCTVVFAIKATQTDKYCGVIKYKIDATRYSKSGGHADPIFVIKFDFGIEEIHPSWNDYMTHKEGDSICYQLSNLRMDKYWPFAVASFAVVLICLCVSIAINE